MAVLFAEGFTPAVPLSHMRVGYEQLLTSASATGSRSGFPAAAALLPETHLRWQGRPEGDVLTLTMQTPALVDYIAIAAHTLESATVEVQVRGDWRPVVTWPLDGPTLISDFAAQDYQLYDEFPDLEAVMILLPGNQPVTGVRITPGNTDATVGFVSAGRVYTHLYPLYAGHRPALLNDQTTQLTVESEAGQYLGNSVIRQGRPAAFALEEVPAPWYRRHLQPLVEHAKTGPVFVAWNALRFPGDVVYGPLTADPRPANNGNLDQMDVEITMRAYSAGTKPAAVDGPYRRVPFGEMWDLANRPSPKWVFGPDGVLTEVPAGEPAYEYDPVTGEALGLLIEEQRTNLLLWSEEPTNWVRDTVTIESGIDDPSGGNTAHRFSNPTNLLRIYTDADAATANQSHTFTFWARLISGTAQAIRLVGVIDVFSFDISSATGEWRKFEVTGAGGSTLFQIRMRSEDQVIDLWHPQLEQGSSPTSYIPTEGSQVTRLADSVGRALGAEFNASEGEISVTATVPVGETVVQAGSFSIVSDSDAEKTYTASYTEDTSATTLDIAPSASAATIKSLTYTPGA